ncbi:MBL fold metallo-hydrolase [Aspergillus stella-maris]|uniref:MBL fold metallo-hydrolase n=1 Tax=Aspergillus stella-maris TaxID=1810926 RepID=UPI003CCE45D5
MPDFPSHTIPPGATARVCLIDTTTTIDNIPFARLVEPPVEGVTKIPILRTYSFFLENSQGRKVLFDLGARKDLQNLAPSVRSMLDTVDWVVKVEKNVLDILQENGYKSTEFEAIIWSHHHWDHIGNVAPFPNHVGLVIGPGFREAYLPGPSALDDCPIPTSDYTGREMIEVDFNGPRSLEIGRMRAHDYFGDGSFYLLDTPGHSVGHLSAVVRTSTNPDTFVILGADAIHETGELRPSQYLPIPETLNLAHLSNPQQNIFCPGHVVHEFQASRGRKSADALFNPTAGYNMADVHSTIGMLQEFDWNENFFFIYAHDGSIKGIVDEFPMPLNDWKEKDWGRLTKWRFLGYYVPCLRSIAASA